MSEESMWSFGSDNNSGASPEIMQALLAANKGHVLGYGDDPWTARARAAFTRLFGEGTETLFVLNGTGSNVLALSLAAGAGQSVLCSDCAHIAVDETGAPEAVAGCKVLPLPSRAGKIDPQALREALDLIGNLHHAQPACLSLSQPTEFGTLYSREEIGRLASIAHEAGLAVHMDGARIANAAVALNLPFNAFTREAGVDLLSFGGMKNGIAFGEALLVFDRDLARRAPYLRKAHLQLMSKMRFIAAQYEVYLEKELWKRNAEKANAAAKALARGLEQLGGIDLVYPVEVNAVFAKIDPRLAEELLRLSFFYNLKGDIFRLMTSFDTPDSAIDTFIKAARTKQGFGI